MKLNIESITLNQAIKISIFVYFVLIVYVLIAPLVVYGCDKEKHVQRFGQFDVCLGSLSQNGSGVNVGLFKAQNEKLVAELTVINRMQSDLLNIFVCEDAYCEEENNNYEILYLLPWYKDGNSRKSVFHDNRKSRKLEYELLVKDPDVLKVDNGNFNNLIKVNVNGKVNYLTSEQFEMHENKDKNGRILHNATKYFVSNLSPEKQVFISNRLKFYVFEKINEQKRELILAFKLNSGEKHIVKIPISIMPFDLLQPDVDTGIYYRGLYSINQPTLSSERKTKKQLEIEFADMLEKGIRYPTVYLYNNYQSYMTIRNKFLFPKDKIFIIDNILLNCLKNDNWDQYQKRLEFIKNDPLFRNYGKLYFYLIDEPDRDKYENILEHVLPILKANEVGVFLAGKAENFQNRIIDGAVYILAYEPSERVAAKFHRQKARVFSYANPQVGVFMPEKFRHNYGFKIIANNYDGIMPYAYQDSFGSQWSDFDSKYRDHMLTYPTSDGLLNTVHGLALQSAITDLRYAATYNHTLENYKLQCGKAYHDPISINEAGKSVPDSMRLRISEEIVKVNHLSEKCRNENH